MALWFNIFLFAHILGVLGLFTALGIEWVSMIGMRRASTVTQVREWAGVNAPLEITHAVVSVLILLSGIAMTVLLQSWTVVWIDASLVILILLSVLGAAVNGQRLKAILVAAKGAPAGALPTSLKQQIDDPILWTCVQTGAVLALGIAFLMVFKPDWIITLLAIMISLVLGIASGQLWSRTSAVQEPSLMGARE